MAAAGRIVWPVLAPCLIVAAISGLAELGTGAQQRTVTLMLVNVVLVVGLYIFSGNSGIISFGHVTFMAVGAYGSGLLTIPLITKAAQFPNLPSPIAEAQLSHVPATLIPAVAAAVIAAVIAIPVMRLVGLAASIATFAVLLVAHVVIAQAGSSTFIGLPLDTTLMSGLAWALLAIVIAGVFQKSRFGLRLKASREDEFAARAAGVNVARERRLAFILSAFVVGIGGSLFGHLQGAFSPEAFFLQATFLMVVMLVTGGINSLAGAVIGTIVVSAALEGLRWIEAGPSIGPVDIPARPNLREVGLGVLLLLILYFRRDGLLGGREILWPFKPRVGPPGAQTVSRAAEPVSGGASGASPS